MNRDRTSSSNDPTAEPTMDQSAPSASGVSRRRSEPGVERDRDLDEDVVNRTGENTTPRRYEQPVDEDDTVMPANDSTLNTKI